MARWSGDHPWRAIVGWLLFVVVCATAGGLVTGRQAEAIDQATGDEKTAISILNEANFPDPPKESVLITARDGRLDTGRATAAAKSISDRMRKESEVDSVGAPVTAKDRQAVLVPVVMKGEIKGADKRVPSLLAATDQVQRDFPELRVEEVGSASIKKAMSDLAMKDLTRAELFSLPVTLIILVFCFGSLIAAGVPVLLAMSSVGAAMGLSALASHLVPSTGTLSSMILLIGMAVGVDYALFYLRRDREERAKGLSHYDAVAVAAATSGHTVVVSGIAVIVSMAGLFLAGSATFSSMAIGSILVVACAVLGSLTVLPALLIKLGDWVDRPRIPLLWRLSRPGKPGQGRFWPTVLRPSLQRPVRTLAVSVAALGVLALPAADMYLKQPGQSDMPHSVPAFQALDRLNKTFPANGDAATHLVAVRGKPGGESRLKAAVAELVRKASADKRFAQDVRPEVRSAKDGRIALVSFVVSGRSDSPQATETLQLLRNELLPATVGSVSGVDYGVTGDTAGEVGFRDQVNGALPLVIAFVLAFTFIVMLISFRSVVIGLTTIALNLLSVGAAYGVLVLVFQYGWGASLLGFTPNGGVTTWLPMMLFVILFGLSMDYHVFVVSRIKEARDRGLSTRDAIAEGITGSAGVVTSAAVVMVAVFAIFGTLSTLDLKQMGVGLASAILIDATVIRAVVLPAAMTALGEWNWWVPRPFRREPRPAESPTVRLTRASVM
ncbi:MMPL family transporter [Pseudonocardiaceae bacterium YIM PH 21723]|nr:MMPL family transporter [Pseudonocardiaceae bacterium YIM PH 21723]